jgi:hypothetical protein
MVGRQLEDEEDQEKEHNVIVNYPNSELDFQTHPYEVCVREVIYVKGAWGTIRNGFNWFQVKPIKDHPIRFTITMDPGTYKTLKEICDIFNKSLEKYMQDTKSWLGFRSMIFRMEGTSMKLYCPDSCECFLSTQIAKQLGVKSDENGNPKPLIDGSVITSEAFKFNATEPEILWLFADFVNPTMMGSYSLPIIRMMPIPPTAAEKHLEHTIFPHPFYVPVKSTKLSCLSVEFHEILDAPPITIEGEVIIQLHFQQINESE